jgi:nucleoside-diphosphate-sugar epimerase
MRVFVTGATGFVGSAVVRELVDAGHTVVGLARSDASEAGLRRAGAEVHRGALDDLDGLHRGAAGADGVIHTAFNNDFSDFEAAAHTDERAIEALGEALVGSGRPLVVTSLTTLIAPGRIATEDDVAAPGTPRVPASEGAVMALAERGVRACVLRLPSVVHGVGDQNGFLPLIIGVAREKGISAFVGEGSNRWAAVHRLDAARAFRLALEGAPAGVRLHAVAEEAVAVRDIARIASARLDLPLTALSPEQAEDHFGPFAQFASLDCPASSTATRKQLDWHPTQPGVVTDFDQPPYFPSR